MSIERGMQIQWGVEEAVGVGMHHGRRRGCWSAVCFHIFRRNCLRRRAEVEDEGARSLRRRRGEDTEEEGRKEGRRGGGRLAT